MYDEKTIDSRLIFEGHIIKVQQDTVRLQNGNTASRELVFHPGGVAILPIDEDGMVTMVRQFRKPIEGALLEVPAGKLEPGENPKICALRELREETGYQAKTLLDLGAAYLSPGFCNEVIYLYVAKALRKGPLDPDEDEFVNPEVYHIDQLVRMVEDGEIRDAKSILLILRVKRLLEQENRKN